MKNKLHLFLFCLLPAFVLAKDPGIEVRDVVLRGELTEEGVVFTAAGKIETERRGETRVALLAGDVALLEKPQLRRAELDYDGAYSLVLDGSGVSEFSIRFLAKAQREADRQSIAFDFLSAPIRRLELSGFPLKDEVQVANAASPERVDELWVAHLSSASALRVEWRPAGSEEGRELFYAADSVDVAAVSAGLIKQNFKVALSVMQGEMSEVAFDLLGEGDISQVEAAYLLGWEVVPTGEGSRRLELRFSRPQQENATIFVRSQAPLPRLPAKAELLNLEPVGAIRHGGHLLLVNDGAVNLGIASQRNLSQISPTLVPLEPNERALLGLEKRQAFGFRFAGSGRVLEIEAADIVPEVAASLIALYHFGLNETGLEAELNLDVREAPLRSFSMDLPDDFSLVGVELKGLSDYALSPLPEGGQRLRILFAKPMMGRQVLRLELERNTAATEGREELPRIVPLEVKSIRGYVGVTADAGLKLDGLRAEGLNELIPSYFPVKRENLQLAYRMREGNWSATVGVERLASSVQVESFHLFSIGEGVAYASSILTYRISGAPVETFALYLPDNYENVELSGAGLRSWKRGEDGRYELNLLGPISGAYSLLATYETHLDAGESLVDFAGARPDGVDSERGYVVFVSPGQLEFSPEPILPPLLNLEASELPPEYLIMLDAPIVAAYEFASRPFSLLARVSALPQQASIDQLVELMKVDSRVSKTGELLFEVDYVLKSKNASSFAVRLPDGARLWRVEVDGIERSPTQDGDRLLIPLENPVSEVARHVRVKYSLSGDVNEAFSVETPRIDAPVLRSDWTVSSDAKTSLRFLEGSVTPVEGAAEVVSFGGWSERSRGLAFAFGLAALVGIVVNFRLQRDEDGLRWLALFGGVVALLGLWLAALLAAELWVWPDERTVPELRFSDTLLSPGQTLSAVFSYHDVSVVQRSSGLSVGFVVASLILPALIVRLFRGASGGVWLSGVVIALLGWAAMGVEYGASLAVLGAGSLLFVQPLAFAVRWLAVWWRGRSWGSVSVRETGATLCLLSLWAVGENRVEARMGEDWREYLDTPVSVEAVVTEDFASVRVSFDWEAKAKDRLPVLAGPSVITSLELPEGRVKLVQGLEGEGDLYFVECLRTGTHRIAFEYQTPVKRADDVWSFSLQSIPSLVYQVSLDVDRENCEAFSEDSVGESYLASSEEGRTRVNLSMRPEWQARIGLRSKGRDARLEKTLFYAETVNAYRPDAGAIVGEHRASLRVAQGQLRFFEVETPEEMTVTDAKADWLESWRFDPATRRLRVVSGLPLAGSVELRVSSQTEGGALPYESSLAGLRFPEASGEVGWLGLFAAPDIQLDRLMEDASLAAVSLTDFPARDAFSEEEGSILRRAFRYVDPAARLTLALSRVEPELRVETDELVSLGEDRIAYTARLQTEILRSGVFQLRLGLPEGLEVESISGAEVSHWTESLENGYRVAVLHMKGRTLGETTQFVTLSGPGARPSDRWEPPRVRLLGVSKQRGRLSLVPELGLRLNLLERSGVTQGDVSGLAASERERRLVYRLLENDWNLAFSIEPVEPWLECSLLQEVARKPGLTETRARLRYEIKNAGVKSLFVRLPEMAVGTRFRGEGVAGFHPIEGDAGLWQVDLDRRAIGSYALDIEYREFGDDDLELVVVNGIQTIGTKLQEGFLALKSERRLSLSPRLNGSGLNRIEWQQIPEDLRSGWSASELAFRASAPDFRVAVDASRLDLAKTLPAQVKSARLRSLLSESGVVLTRATFEIDPGRKPHLRLRLPEGAEFWACYVNECSVWPSQKEGDLLAPLELASQRDKEICRLELVYAMEAGENEDGEIAFVGPQCELPLENIEWQVFVSGGLGNPRWGGTLELLEQGGLVVCDFSLESAMSLDFRVQGERVKAAESLLLLGSDLADRGDARAARRALESAYRLSQHDLDFNEDARVQLNNLKVEQAMVGLSSRRLQSLGGQVESEVRFSREEADRLLTANSAEESRALTELAQRFVAHQDAALSSPTALRAGFPEHGRSFRFARRLQAEPWQEMHLTLEEGKSSAAGAPVVFVALALFGLAALQGWNARRGK